MGRQQCQLPGLSSGLLFGLALGCVLFAAPESILAEDWSQMRKQLVEEIEQDTYQTRGYLGKATLSANVLNAIGKVERHRFVPEAYQSRAYGNHPLPIGDEQTISQPFIVALMTDLLAVDNTSRILEIGTGSGYQAAVLAEIVAQVYSIEIVANLARGAATRLALLGYHNIEVRHGDGMLGWQENAPFDGIIVTAAGLEIPETLISQLKPGGRLVMPVGAQSEVQQLKVMTKSQDGSVQSRDVLPVRFVPITDKVR